MNINELITRLINIRNKNVACTFRQNGSPKRYFENLDIKDIYIRDDLVKVKLIPFADFTHYFEDRIERPLE